MSTIETSTSAATTAATTSAGTTSAGTTSAGTTAAGTTTTAIPTTTMMAEEEDQQCNENKDLKKFLTGLLLLLVFGLLIYYIWQYLEEKKNPGSGPSTESNRLYLSATPLASDAYAAVRARGAAPSPLGRGSSRPGTQYEPAYDVASQSGRGANKYFF